MSLLCHCLNRSTHIGLSPWLSGLIRFLSHSTCWALLAGDLQRPGIKSRSRRELSVGWTNGRYVMRLISQTGTEGPPVSSLNCDRCRLWSYDITAGHKCEYYYYYYYYYYYDNVVWTCGPFWLRIFRWTFWCPQKEPEQLLLVQASSFLCTYLNHLSQFLCNTHCILSTANLSVSLTDPTKSCHTSIYLFSFLFVFVLSQVPLLLSTFHLRVLSELSLQVWLVFVIVILVMTMSFHCELTCKGFSVEKALYLVTEQNDLCCFIGLTFTVSLKLRCLQL